MKRRYMKAELEVLEFATEDIVTASEVADVGGNEDIEERVPLGTENMQGGGSVGVDWNK